MTTWSFGGVELSDFGNVIQMDDYLDIPETRGDNQRIPYQHGTIFTKKFYEERKVALGLAVFGVDVEEVETKIDNLKLLVGNRNPQVLEVTLDSGDIRRSLATVETAFNLSRPAPHVAKLMLDFVLTEPFFRSSIFLSEDTVINASPTTFTLTNSGNVEETSPKITLNGPLENTEITNTTNDCVLKYNAIIAGGDVVEIQRLNGEWIALENGATNVIGNVTHSGHWALMVFDVGDNEMSITDDDATTGSVTIEFYPPHL